jgi:asparagine synthase (glutamine-hydrolysing)
MCGIVGVVRPSGQSSAGQLEGLVLHMAQLQAHRGPDDSGEWVDPAAGVALGHRRLSIIDLRPEGRQPMSAPGCRSTVTFNGEIYNFQDIKKRLLAKGCGFNSLSDTEILPHLFDDLNPAGLSQLVGMFAFAVWNPDRKQLMLARDAFGKKPLYIYEDGDTFAFSSEIQSFYALENFDATIDQDAVAEYLMLSYLVGPKTIYKKVRMLPAGSWATFSFESGRAKEVDAGQFFHFHAHESAAMAPLDRRVVKDRLRSLLIQSVERRMISDVPLGAFLSGGVDSALVCAVVRKELGKELDTFSIGFEGSAESEHEQAREISAYLGTRHHDKMLAPEGLAMMDHIAGILDQPNGDSSCLPTWLLSQFAREHVTVCLSGDGGDELFGGYGRYRDTMNDLGDPARIAAIGLGIDPADARPSDVYQSLRWHIWLPAQARALMGGFSPDVEAMVGRWQGILNDPADPVMHRMRNIDTWLYMPGAVLAKVDRMSMQHALEVRCPLLDRDFAEYAMGVHTSDCWIAPSTTKSILKEIASDYLPREWMYRSKKGFGLPSQAWSMDNIIGLCRSTLQVPDAEIRSVLDPDVLDATVNFQAQPGQFSIYQMWPLLILQKWLAAQPAKIEAARATAGRLALAH